MKNIKIDESKVLGAIVVLENYIEGALSDFENKDVENTSVLEDCIYIHRLLELVNCNISCLFEDEYKNRFDKVLKEQQ